MTTAHHSSSAHRSSSSQAQIYSRGYRRYDGERGGLASSMWAVAAQSIRYMLGIGRSAWAKVAPIALTILRLLGALFTVAIVALFGSELGDEFQTGYANSVSGSLNMVTLFTALAAPGILVNDRRSGMYDMYLTTILTKPTYLASKALGLLLALTVFILGPAAITFVGFTLFGIGPDGFGLWLLTALRILVASAIVAALFGGLAMAISAVSRRALIAGLAIIGILVGTSIVAAVLTEGLEYGSEWALLSTYFTAAAASNATFGEAIPTEVGATYVWGATAAHVLAPMLVVWWAYRGEGGAE